MFPFKTKEFLYKTNLTVEEFNARLTTKVNKCEPLSFKEDGQLYGIIKNNNAILELGQKSYRNSFRPVIVFQWIETQSGVEIKGYYRIGLSVLIATLVIPIFGLYPSISIQNILPVLILSAIWIIIYSTFGLWCFNKDFKLTQEEVLTLIK